MVIYKFNYRDLREMPLEEMLEKSKTYNLDSLLSSNFQEIPNGSRGVYTLYSLTEKPLYTGKSENIRNRIKRHLKGQEKITEMYAPFITTVRVFYVDDEVRRQNLFSVERWFISQLKPYFNVTRVHHTANVT